MRSASPSRPKPADKESRPLEPFRVKPHDFRFDPKLNLDKLNLALDELEAFEAAKKLGK